MKRGGFEVKILKWEQSSSGYVSHKVGKLGKHKAFSIMHDGMSSRNQKDKIKLTCYLNGIRAELGNFISEEIAKEKAEMVLKLWLNSSGLEVK